jgi:arginase
MSSYGSFNANDVGNAPLVVSFAACYQGQSRTGVEHAWMALTGTDTLLDASFVDFRDSRKFDDAVRGSVLLSRNIYHALEKSSLHCAQTAVSLCFGGDHTISIGTIMASRKQNPRTRVIWVDAHPDINTPETSLSGNCHGMPVAHVMGLVDGFHVNSPVKPEEIAYIGLRSIDDAEQLRLDAIRDGGGLVFTMKTVDENGIDCVIKKIEESWLGDQDQCEFPIHVSLDIDSMDPEFTPATGTPVPNGLSPDEVMRVLRWANRRAQNGICHLDIVELNPYLCSARDAAVTIGTTSSVLSSWLSSHSVINRSGAGSATGSSLPAQAADAQSYWTPQPPRSTRTSEFETRRGIRLGRNSAGQASATQ